MNTSDSEFWIRQLDKLSNEQKNIFQSNNNNNSRDNELLLDISDPPRGIMKADHVQFHFPTTNTSTTTTTTTAISSSSSITNKSNKEINDLVIDFTALMAEESTVKPIEFTCSLDDLIDDQSQVIQSVIDTMRKQDTRTTVQEPKRKPQLNLNAPEFKPKAIFYDNPHH
ncbi:uncharacterized protein RHIMIDRAFT_244482 [Rhizopus microsporus ATCC 52813]|uniref:Uncharacterized protein n=1 Tax=Rhizopus microsporus ATCC 52813 TaxID=1340429 RepID=A0A2G4SR68_RHIZD|nr:uncharacterized protein RHIMIDRAFT_244482 [Rhizopus microsporus ATCC 52813]PHZ11269.1 hypothetical protein RHIMIDRAFT_244482 [Rhizopus microsporus ATCC 52813]